MRNTYAFVNSFPSKMGIFSASVVARPLSFIAHHLTAAHIHVHVAVNFIARDYHQNSYAAQFIHGAASSVIHNLCFAFCTLASVIHQPKRNETKPRWLNIFEFVLCMRNLVMYIIFAPCAATRNSLIDGRHTHFPLCHLLI